MTGFTRNAKRCAPGVHSKAAGPAPSRWLMPELLIAQALLEQQS